MPGARLEIHDAAGTLVAEGSVFSTHRVVVHQLTDDPVSTIVWNSVAEFEAAHTGQAGTVTYLDDLPPAPPEPAPPEEPDVLGDGATIQEVAP